MIRIDLRGGEGNFSIKSRGNVYQHRFFLYNKGELDLYGDCFITTHGGITGNARLNMEVHVKKNSVAFDNLIGYFSRFPLQSMKRIAYAH